MSSRPSPSPSLDGAIAGLLEVYREVDRRVGATGARCEMRGLCCDFEKSDHRLYATHLEIVFVLQRHRGAFPGGGPLCPFWKDGLCMERERRPLGCRTYFCDGREREALQQIHEDALERIRRISAEHGLPHGYRPFVDAVRGGNHGA